MTRTAIIALAAAVGIAAGCAQDPTPSAVHLVSARAQYTEHRADGKSWDAGLSPGPEVIAHFTVDGVFRRNCKKRWTALEFICELDLDVPPTAQLALVVEDDDGNSAEHMGEATLTLANFAERSKTTLPLVVEGSVLHGSVTLQSRWQPRVPLAYASLLLIGAGALLALLLYALLRHRFVAGERRGAAVASTSVRSPAMLSAGFAAIAAWIAMVPLLDHAQTLEPLALAVPTGLGAYATTATVIDAFASHSFGRRRGQLLFSAIMAIAALPIVMSIAAIPPKLLIIGILIVAISVFV